MYIVVLWGGYAIHFFLKDGVFFAPEKIDETTSLPPLDPDAPQPLLLNFAGVRTINSYGTRRLLTFVRAWRPRPLEFHDCPSIFVDTLNIVRDLLGSPRDPGIVKSFAIPYFCAPCELYFDVMVAAGAVDAGADDLGLPPRSCPKCQGVTEVDVDPEEHLAFLSNG